MDDLTRLLHDTVEGVEPAERLAEIRREARGRRTRRWYAAGGAALAVAAVVTAVAVVGQRPDAGPGPGPAVSDPTATETPTAEPTPQEPPVEEQAVPIYYVGPTPDGPRLFREFHRVAAGTDPAALVALEPVDPDYATDWLPGTVLAVTEGPGVTEVAVDIAPDRSLDVQQLVYTVTGALGSDLPVQLTVDGQPVGDPVDRDPRVLAPVNISDPGERREVTGHFGAQGAVRGAGDVLWELYQGTDVVVASGTADRTEVDWATPDIDVSTLTPGPYTFMVTLDRLDGDSPPSDTRTVIVR